MVLIMLGVSTKEGFHYGIEIPLVSFSYIFSVFLLKKVISHACSVKQGITGGLIHCIHV